MRHILAGLVCLVASAAAQNLQLEEMDGSDPRLFFANYTSSLIAVNSTILAYALLAVAIAGAAAVALYYLYLESASSKSYGSYGQSYGQDSGHDYYGQAR